MRDENEFTDIQGLEHLFQREEASSGAHSETGEAARAVSYVRVSNPKQLRTGMDIDADGNSLATQRQHAKRRAAELNAEIVKEFSERGRSAQSIAHRPAFRAMLQYIEDHPGEIKYVLVYARSRAFRNYDDSSEIEARLRRQGVEIVSATESFSADPDTAFLEKLIKDWTNAKYVKDNGRDIAAKMQHKAERGGFNGRAKIGYLNDKVKVDGYFVNTISVDPERAPLIRWAFEAYATGNYSLPQLRQELTDLGLMTRETPSFRSQPISLSQLARVLRDPIYTGVILYNRKLYPGRHEPIITKDLYLRVQEVLSGRVRRGLRDRVHHHYLRGLIFCQRCEQRGVTSQLVFTQAEGHGGTYEYFFCTRRKDGDCDLPYVPVAEVERAVGDELNKRHLSQKSIDELRGDLAAALSAHDEAALIIQRNIKRQLNRLEGQEDRIIEMVADGDLPVDKLKARLRAVVLQREHLQERLARTDQELQSGVQNIDAYLDLLRDPGRLYERSEDPVRRQLLDSFFSSILINMEDTVALEVTMLPAVRALVEIEGPTSFINEMSPRLSAGARFVLLADQLLALIGPSGSNKTNLVAGTGFEPATSGL